MNLYGLSSKNKPSMLEICEANDHWKLKYIIFVPHFRCFGFVTNYAVAYLDFQCSPVTHTNAVLAEVLYKIAVLPLSLYTYTMLAFASTIVFAQVEDIAMAIYWCFSCGFRFKFGDFESEERLREMEDQFALAVT